MKLAEGKPLRRRMMAAMAQQDCGQCGYNCSDYSRAIFEQVEPRRQALEDVWADTGSAQLGMRPLGGEGRVQRAQLGRDPLPRIVQHGRPDRVELPLRCGQTSTPTARARSGCDERGRKRSLPAFCPSTCHTPEHLATKGPTPTG